ncbi:unnamed protein product [Echinostoma caproni]|uniref:glutathione transferase n=1 Tax=Echinostoma caproni TaxID=27848 RepID=A0A183B5J3_9TREM|nr:unnamed protein product [Echinostoma caproni]
MSPVLGYWKLRGLAQPIRLLLEFVGDKYEERLYDRQDREKWQSDKYNLGLDLPNLPYYIDGNVKLSQSLAILRYIADKHGMIGSTPEERARVSMVEGAACDLRQGLSRIAYNPQFEQLKHDYLENLPATLTMWSKFLGDKHYLLGNSVSIELRCRWELPFLLLIVAIHLYNLGFCSGLSFVNCS